MRRFWTEVGIDAARVVTLDGVAFAGSSFVPITPFGLKDWERFDTEGAPSPLQLGKPTVSLADLATRPTI